MPKVEECRHILTTGRRCGCPALTAKAYCYFHFRSRARHTPPPRATRPVAEPLILHPMRADGLGQAEPTLATPATAPLPAPPLELDFPVLEDRESIQVAASMIVAALGRNQLDGKRAATMLYGLQVAAAVTHFDLADRETYEVETDIVPAPDGGDLAVIQLDPHSTLHRSEGEANAHGG